MSQLVMLQPYEELVQQIKWDSQGLAAVIVQDASTLEVLTLAYMNRESLLKTVETGETWFWSRSRSELWHKGETSGNTQQVTELKMDCDGDALLVRVNRKGPACHTGEESCFSRTVAEGALPKASVSEGYGESDTTSDAGRFEVLAELERIIAQREVDRPEGAYTTYLFDKGIDKILKKVGEEAAESIIAAKNQDNNELRMEVSDLIYHLLVLLQERKLPLDEVLGELALRHERPRRS